MFNIKEVLKQCFVFFYDFKKFMSFDYSEYCSCCDSFTKIESGCSPHQGNFKNCNFQYKKICINCIRKCDDCGTEYCLECWEKKDSIDFPCISHRHCKSCIYKPSHCNVYPMSACSCGCGDYSLHKLVWKSKTDQTLARKHFEKYE